MIRKLGAPVLLFLLCVGFYWKLTLTNQYSFLDSPDLAYLDLPRLQFQASEWRHLRFPLWDPNHWIGQPFLGQVTGAAYPANWLLGVFPFREGKLNVNVVHWYFVLIHFQAALFCFFLCRDWGRSRAASVLGGVVFSFGGFLGCTDWPQILNGILWLPLVILFLFRALRRERAWFSASMSGALLGMAWLSGHHEVPIYSTVVVAGVWVVAVWRGADWRLAVVAGGALCLIAAGQVLPAQEYAPLAKRWAGMPDPIAWNVPIPYQVHQEFSWTPTAVLGIATPRPEVHVTPFIGIVAFGLALLGVYHGWRRRPQVRVVVMVSLAGVFLALATSNFLHGVLYSVLPVFGKARVPARALALFSFGVAPLVAYGFDALGRRSSEWLGRTIWGLAGIGGVIYGALTLGVGQVSNAAMLTALMAMLGAGLLAGWRAGTVTRGWLGVAVVMLVTMEIGNVSGAAMASRLAEKRPGYLERLFHHGDIVNFLRGQAQPLRVEVADADVPYNFGDWHGIPTTAGYVASGTTNLVELERHRPRMHDLFGANFYVSRTPSRPELVLVMAGESGVNVYRNPMALPRVWAVHTVTQVASYGQLRARLEAAEFVARREALMLGVPPVLEACAGEEEGRLVPLSSPNRVRMEVKMGCRGLVVLSDTYFPGWTATVDGKPVGILEVYGALRGVVVEKGEHRIEMVYRPWSALVGGGLSLLGIGLLLWVWWWSARVGGYGREVGRCRR